MEKHEIDGKTFETKEEFQEYLDGRLEAQRVGPDMTVGILKNILEDFYDEQTVIVAVFGGNNAIYQVKGVYDNGGPQLNIFEDETL